MASGVRNASSGSSLSQKSFSLVSIAKRASSFEPKEKRRKSNSSAKEKNAKNLSFAELQTTSNFSFLRGASHPGELVEQAAKLGYKALAITDLNTLAGVVRAHSAAKENSIKLIIGSRIQCYRELREENLIDELENLLPFSLLLHATNRESYQLLSTLLTTGKLRAPKGKCFLLPEDLFPFHKNLLATAVIHNFNDPELKSSLALLKELFQDRFSLAFSSTYSPRDQKHQQEIIGLSKMLETPLLATNDVHYHIPERRMLQDALTCIRLGCTIEQAGFKLLSNSERYLKSLPELAHLFRSTPEALTRSLELSERCAFSLDELKYEYPHEICPEGKNPYEYLRELVIVGCKKHYPEGVPKKVVSQIAYELGIIRDLSYEKYFLTVYDIVKFARSQGILCQGRGAAANSAICYVLDITAVDPAQIRLLFDRFISKERNEPPDIDIDFEHERREEVIQYIYQKYGRLRAALTAEVVSYRTRSSLRDIGKVFGLSIEEIESLIKIKTRSSMREITFEKLIEYELDPNNPAIEHTIMLSDTLRSFPRHLSQHVGGFVISNPPLCEIVPIENASMPERSTIEWDKDDIECLGMLKIDVLGLGILSCLRKAFELINTNERKDIEKLNLHTLPREDPAVYNMISKADTIGVFQIESRAQMTMLPRLRPQCFYDLVVEVAIVRPGPIQGGMVHPYLRRRQGLERVEYPDERVKTILERTLGVPIFQEQVMELAVVAAGFTAGEADQLRRAMASWKKDANALLKFEERVKNGMRANGYSESFGNQLFEQMKGFGEYGFPQSHSASFALLVYASAWLKHHYPAHFTAALLNSLPMGFYQPAQLVQDAKNHRVEVLEVDVNSSGWDSSLDYQAKKESFLPANLSGKTGTPALRLGMRLIRGAREVEAEKIVKAVQSQGTFSSILSLWRASGARISQLKLLAKADAFRSLGQNRQEALWNIKKLRDDHLPLFEGQADREEPVNLPALAESLHVLRDYQMTGLSLKSHPMSFIRPVLDRHSVSTIEEFKKTSSGKRLAIAGLVLVRQRPSTAKGTIFMTIEDETGMANLIIWPAIFERFTDSILDAVFLVAAGKVQRESGVIHLIVEEVIDISLHYKGLDSHSRDFH